MNKEFKNLDALRGIMAMYVSVIHFGVLYYLNKHNKLVFTKLSFIGAVQLGQVFMTVFFVLSGFLITYILLIEKEKHSTINFKRFYIRRAFRIFPMYFIAVFFVLYLYKKACLNVAIGSTPLCMELKERACYYLFFIPNWAHVIDKTLPHISNFWSIGAEEQFYIIWPFIIYFSRNYLRAFFGIYVFYGLVLIVSYVFRLYYDGNEMFLHIAKMLDYTRFGAFAFGGVVAHLSLYPNHSNFTKKLQLIITKRSTQWCCFFFTICLKFFS